ncbi:hypothetical protein ID866_10312 [Astraeus odoratus]|nr:hypothetical protein ID866_10312 [Astraeus odoratus]
MGFWYPSLLLGYQSTLPFAWVSVNTPFCLGISQHSLLLGYQSTLPFPPHSQPIFFFKAFAVLMAIQVVTCHIPHGAHIAIFSENLNMVSMFNSLAALPQYDQILLNVIDILLQHDLDFQVFHVPGASNLLLMLSLIGTMIMCCTLSLSLLFTPFNPLETCWGQPSSDFSLLSF